MSKDIRRKSEDLSEQKEPSAPSIQQEPTLEYSDWFASRLKNHRRLRVHHHNAIQAYFRDNGLSDQESSHTFDSMLKVFGF